jgi:hypothetical protein
VYIYSPHKLVPVTQALVLPVPLWDPKSPVTVATLPNEPGVSIPITKPKAIRARPLVHYSSVAASINVTQHATRVSVALARWKRSNHATVVAMKERHAAVPESRFSYVDIRATIAVTKSATLSINVVSMRVKRAAILVMPIQRRVRLIHL